MWIDPDHALRQTLVYGSSCVEDLVKKGFTNRCVFWFNE